MHFKHSSSALASLVMIGSLSACSIMPKHTESTSAEALIAKNLQESLNRIERTQTELAQAGGLEQAKSGISSQVYFDNQSVSFQWYGDAYTAVQKLADQRGYKFFSSGVKLPLPIAIDVKNISYTALLQRIQTQIGYRASIDVNHTRHEISLRYTQPNARGADHLANIQTSGQSYAAAKPVFVATSASNSQPQKFEQASNPLQVFRSGGGKSQTLNVAVNQIIPTGWKAEINAAIQEKYKTQRFTWEGNDWWPQVLNKTLQSTTIRYTTDTVNKRILFTDPKLKVVANTPNIPSDKLAKPTTNTLVTHPVSTGLVTKPITGTLVKSVEIGREWVARSGTTLKESITDWASHATCVRGGSWIVMWPTNVDYGIAAPVTMKGSFEEAIVKMFDLYSAAEKPLYVLANRNQCTIAVDDKPQKL